MVLYLEVLLKKRANICFQVVQTPVPVYLLESVHAVIAEEDEWPSAENTFFEFGLGPWEENNIATCLT